jgi:hypothetical protein
LVSLVLYDFWSNVSRCSTLLSDHHILLHNLTHSKVTDHDLLVVIEKDVVKLDVSMQDASAMTVAKSIDDLLEEEVSFAFFQFSLFLHVLKEISLACILHDHEEMLWGFEYFQQSNDVGMPDLLEDVDFLEDLCSRELIFHVRLVNGLDGYFLSCELMDS